MITTKKFARFTYFIMRGLLVLAFVLFLVFGSWVDAFSTFFIFFLMTLPSVLKEKYRFYLPIELEVVIVAHIFLTLFLGSIRNFYERFTLWDGILHFQSGLLLGVVGFILVYILNTKSTKKLALSPGFVSLFAVTFSLAISVVWEIYEYAMDLWFGFHMQESGLPDTMGDFIVNTIGALIVAVIGYFWMRKKGQIPFTDIILKGHETIKK